MKPGQLPLALFATGDADFAGYFPGENREAVLAVAAWADGNGPWSLCLWGRSGVGKSHLLQAAVRAAGERARRAMYLPLRDLARHGAVALEGLEAVDVLCVDDVDTIVGDLAWEHALFRLHNACAAIPGRLAFASAEPPLALACALPDLKSRLCAALTYRLQELSETAKQQALAAAAARRGLDLPDAVANYLLRRQSRDLSGLLETLETLDRASLSEGRPLTVPFVREVLGFTDRDLAR